MKKKKNLGFNTKSVTSNSTKLAVIVLGILFFLLIFARVVGFIQSLYKPLSPDLKSTNGYSWDKKSAINLVFAKVESVDETKINVVHLDPKEGQIAILEISPQVLTAVPKGFGSWRIGSIYNLGQEANPPIGGELLKLSVSKLLGLPIDGLVILKDNHSDISEFISSVHKNKLALLSIFSKVESDLTPLEIIDIFYAYSDVRSDKIVSLNFEKSSVTESKLLPDTSRVLGIDNVKLDLFVRGNLADSNIEDEAATVAIFNGTQNPGLTAESSRLVSNMGGDVISVNTTGHPYAKSQVVINKNVGESSSVQTAKRLTEIFAPNCLQKECVTDDSKITSSRAQINIILGEDYYQKWYVK